MWRVARRAARNSARRARTRGNAAKNHRASSARIGARCENFRYRIESAAENILQCKSAKPAAATGGGGAHAGTRGKDSQGMILKIAQRGGQLAHKLCLVAEHPLRVRHDAFANCCGVMPV